MTSEHTEASGWIGTSTAVAPYGSWRSPVTAKLIAGGGVGVMWPQSVGESLYWVELRPLEDGRYVVVRRAPDGWIADVTPSGVSARTLVHEYGGGMYVAFRAKDGGESVIFSDQSDQRLYRQDLEPADDSPREADGAPREAGGSPGGTAATPVWSAPRHLTPEPPAARAYRYADGRVTPDGRVLVSVRERHEADGEVVNELVSVPTDGSAEPHMVASGHDFYAAPRLSADGRRVAWVAWDHPCMPWDGTELWTAELAGNGSVSDERLVAGGPEESILQPLWSPSGELWFASDRTGWWNLYAVDPAQPGRAGLQEPCPLVTRAAEFAGVPWVFGLQNYTFLDDGRLCISNNAAERALRGIAVGRHNWTFAGSVFGDTGAAEIYTVVVSNSIGSVTSAAATLTDSLGALRSLTMLRQAERSAAPSGSLSCLAITRPSPSSSRSKGTS